MDCVAERLPALISQRNNEPKRYKPDSSKRRINAHLPAWVPRLYASFGLLRDEKGDNEKVLEGSKEDHRGTGEIAVIQ